jgi:acetyl esterase/lipase
MIHGGGHIVLSKKNIRSKQTNILLKQGFLPVSVDYRLCPEVGIIEGPMSDVCTALEWARNVLPRLNLSRPDIQVEGDKVVVIGWSTGGHLAMTLAWTSLLRGIRPPDAILTFYSPTDYASEFWKSPNFPEKSEAYAKEMYNILEGVKEQPVSQTLQPTFCQC